MRNEDFSKFKYIFGMDESNLEDVNELKPPSSTAIVKRLGEFDPEKVLNVRDPYYDNGDKGFYTCFDHCKRSLEAFLKTVES